MITITIRDATKVVFINLAAVVDAANAREI